MGFTIASQPRVPFFVATAQPTSPITGDFWFKSDTGVLYQYDGAAFDVVSPNPNFKLLGTQTLAGAANSIDLSGLTTSDYKALFVVCEIVAVSGNSAIGIRFNGDSGNNYTMNSAHISNATTWSRTTNNPYSGVGYGGISSGNSGLITFTVTNTATRIKLINGTQTTSIPDYMTIIGGRWANTANTITQVTIHDYNGANLGIGTVLQVYGIT